MTRSDTPVTSTIELRPLRAFTLELLAYTVCELFPGTLLMQGEITSAGFSYEFLFNQIPNEEMLHIIEEGLRKNFKEVDSFEIRDMMRENAATFFEHLEQPLKAEEILNHSDNVVTLIKIGEFHDLKPLSLQKALFGVPKLFSLKTFKRDELTVTRIDGTVFPDLKLLKEYVKTLKGIEKKEPLELGKKLGLFELLPEGLLLFPRGEALKQAIITEINAFAEDAGYSHVSSPLPLSTKNLLPFQRFCEGFACWSVEETPIQSRLELPRSTVLKVSFTEGEKTLLDKCISSLQFIEKTIKIFDLNRKWVLCTLTRKEGSSERKKISEFLAAAIDAAGFSFEEDSESPNCSSPRLEIRVSDERGIEWTLATVSLSGKIVSLQVGPLEGLMALVIEKTAGELPVWLLPEQVRVLPVEKRNVKYAQEVRNACHTQKIRSGIDLFGLQSEGNYSVERSKNLAEKLHLAIQHKVPYILIVGDSEESSHKVALRSISSEKSKLMKLEEFFAFLSEKDKEQQGVK